MSKLFLTIVIACIVVACAIALLSIGWLITGKSRIIRGACGMDPTKARNKECGKEVKCDVCAPQDKEEEDES